MSISLAEVVEKIKKQKENKKQLVLEKEMLIVA